MGKTKDHFKQRHFQKYIRQKFAKTILLAVATFLSSSTLVYSYVPMENAIAKTEEGGPGSDTLTGTSDSDTLRGRGGDDTIDGLGDKDRLFGNDDNDHIDGGSGRDRIF